MTWRRIRWYLDSVGCWFCGVLFGYLVAEGYWIAAVPAVGAFIGGMSYSTRHYFSG